MQKNNLRGLPQLILPLDIENEMHEYIQGRIQAFPREAIVETVSEWAEKNRILGSGITARPGRVDFSVTPFLREIVDCLSDCSPVQEVYLIKGTQQGGSVMILENHMGYCIKYGIGPLLYVGGDQAMAEDVMEKRVDEMIESAGLQGRIKANVIKAKGKSTGDRADSKSYGGTFMRAVGPNSESKLRTFPMRILHLDETDVYPQRIVKGSDSSADPIEKANRRADSYGNIKKIAGISTPKDETTSRIEKLVNEGDKRYYNITCPKCGFQQPLLWTNFKWDKTPEGKPDIRRDIINGVEVITKDPTYFICADEKCGHKIYHKDKREILQEKGHGGSAEWIPTKKSDRPFVQSYVLPAWYGFRTWLDILIQWERVKDDPFLLPTFVNDVMAETWKENTVKPNENELYLLAQEYEHWKRGEIKREIIYLTLAADIQKDRIECGLVGWGRNRQGYLIDYWTHSGDPSTVENVCWKKLSENIQAKYMREDGQELFVQVAFVDSQYLSDTVDLFCDSFPYDPNGIAGVYPIQGRESQDKLIKRFKSNIKTPVIGLHDQQYKLALYNILRKRPQGPGSFPSHYLHFSYEYDNELYKQLTAEEIVKITVKGEVKGVKILNTKQKRNEVLDVMKMNMGALQFSIDKFFELLNENQKLQKRSEIQESSDLFFDHIENTLYSD
jgi:phage terminase large subunit GpA-like protein